MNGRLKGMRTGDEPPFSFLTQETGMSSIKVGPRLRRQPFFRKKKSMMLKSNVQKRVHPSSGSAIYPENQIGYVFRIKSNSPVKEITNHSDSSTRVAPKSCPLAGSDEGGSSKIAINTTKSSVKQSLTEQPRTLALSISPVK